MSVWESPTRQFSDAAVTSFANGLSLLWPCFDREPAKVNLRIS
jgi:hypothetical protein